MKLIKIQLPIVLCLFFLAASAQEEGTAEATDNNQETKHLLSTNINESENKEKMLEKLEDIKMHIDEKEEQLHYLEKNRYRLSVYKEALKEIDYQLLNQSVKTIAKHIRERDKGKLLLEEKRLRNRLEEFFNLFDEGDTTVDNSGIDTRQNFYESFNTLMEKLKHDPAVAGFLYAPPDQVFFTDTFTLEALRVSLVEEWGHHLHASLKEAMLKETNYIIRKEFKVEKEINFLKGTKRNILDKLKGEANIDLFSILLGLPLFCITIIFLFMGPGFIHAKFSNNNGMANPLLEKSQNVLMDLSTVLLLTMSVLILGLSGNINSDVLGTLIGGISGYVLNKTKA